MDNTKKDFIEYIMKLNNQNRKVITQDDNETLFIIITVISDTRKELIITFTSITKAAVYTKGFTYDSFSEYKASIGFAGSWKSFINTMFNAINHKEGGEVKMELKKKKLTMTLLYSLANDLKVSSQIIFDNRYSIDDREYNAIVFASLINLYENKIEIEKTSEREHADQRKDREEKSLVAINSNHNNNAIGQRDVGRGVLEMKKNVKRKYKSNLINPNIKKRKKKGVEFIKDDEEGEAEAENSDNE